MTVCICVRACLCKCVHDWDFFIATIVCLLGRPWWSPYARFIQAIDDVRELVAWSLSLKFVMYYVLLLSGCLEYPALGPSFRNFIRHLGSGFLFVYLLRLLCCSTYLLSCPVLIKKKKKQLLCCSHICCWYEFGVYWLCRFWMKNFLIRQHVAGNRQSRSLWL